MTVRRLSLCFFLFATLHAGVVHAQGTERHGWIRPDDAAGEAVWGIENGIVFSLWPYGLENREQRPYGGGPRGLIRVGYQYGNETYMINFLAIEPVVNGKMEFSEISPSKVDGIWGTLMIADEVAINKIHLIREQKVMLDSDLAELYGVETRRLKEQVRRNMIRFPAHFMFELTREEYDLILR